MSGAAPIRYSMFSVRLLQPIFSSFKQIGSTETISVLPCSPRKDKTDPEKYNSTPGRNVSTHRPVDRFPPCTDIIQMLERDTNHMRSYVPLQ